MRTALRFLWIRACSVVSDSLGPYGEGIKPVPLSVKVHFSSVARLCLTLCDPMNRSTPGLPVHRQRGRVES